MKKLLLSVVVAVILVIGSVASLDQSEQAGDITTDSYDPGVGGDE